MATVKPAILSDLSEHELERLRRDVYRPDAEKFKLLVQMFRNNALLRKAKIHHK